MADAKERVSMISLNDFRINISRPFGTQAAKMKTRKFKLRLDIPGWLLDVQSFS